METESNLVSDSRPNTPHKVEKGDSHLNNWGLRTFCTFAKSSLVFDWISPETQLFSVGWTIGRNAWGFSVPGELPLVTSSFSQSPLLPLLWVTSGFSVAMPQLALQKAPCSLRTVRTAVGTDWGKHREPEPPFGRTAISRLRLSVAKAQVHCHVQSS